MWIATQDGFYSVVQMQADPATLQIRGRVRSDLEGLRDRYLPSKEVIENPEACFPFQILVDRGELAECLAGIARDVCYPNFLAHVGKEQGFARSRLYMKVWSLMHRLATLGRGAEGRLEL